MATLKTISAALKLLDVKKENLKKAFEDLESHSSSLSSFTLTWSDLDSYFISFQSSLQYKFNLLQSLELQPSQLQPPSNSESFPKQQKKNPSFSSIITKIPSDLVPFDVPARPELKSFCEKMDGLGLRKYVDERPKERTAIRVELADALRYAPDPAAMVLDALEGFYARNLKFEKLISLRGSCLVLLDELMQAKVEIGAESRERAKKVAVEWKGKMSMSVNLEKTLEALGFLHLLTTYGLVDVFNIDEILEYVTVAARRRQVMNLCHVLIPSDKLPGLIQKLISKGKQLVAVKFIFEFKLTDKFPPVPLLNGYVMEAKKLAQKIQKNGRNSRSSSNDAIVREVDALKSVIKQIEDHNLESEYPKEILVKRIKKLEKQKRKRPTSFASPKPQHQSMHQKQGGSKRLRTSEPASPATMPQGVAPNSSVPSIQRPHLQIGLLPDHPASYLSSTVGPYSLAGSAPAGSSVCMYGLSGVPVDFLGNLNAAGSNLYPSESQIPSGYYDGAYELPPQYHTSYNPQ